MNPWPSAPHLTDVALVGGRPPLSEQQRSAMAGEYWRAVLDGCRASVLLDEDWLPWDGHRRREQLR